jgi:L-malate glycosyltransferase
MSRPLKILIVCPYPIGEVPGQRLKYEQYFDFLQKNGFEIRVHSFFLPYFYRDLYARGKFLKKILGTLVGYILRTLTLFRLPFYDGIYIFLNVTPFFGCFYEAAFRYLSRKMIYDIDDLVFLSRTSKQNAIVSRLRRPSKYFFLMSTADHVITCTPYLDSIAKKYNSKTTDISSTVNTSVYVPSVRYEKKKKLVLGWSGSHSTSAYLKLLYKVLMRLKELYDFELLVIGDPSFRLDGLSIVALPWQIETEVADLSRIDIGLYPLPNDEWVLGKSGLKAIQYMALGIPTVATAVGANFRVIEDGVSGFLVRTDDEWFLALTQLIENPLMRRKIGFAARARIEERFSVDANANTYLKIFRETYGQLHV